MTKQERRFKQGEHICAVYEDGDDQSAVAAAYIAEGLRCGERCLYANGSDAELRRFRDALAAHGIDADAEVARGALIVATNAEIHLPEGHFDCEAMLRQLNNAVEAALNDGFTGLRTCGDMSWLADQPAGSERVVEYEALLSPFFRNVRALGMCQYDRRRLPPTLMDGGLATHSSATIGRSLISNPHYDAARTRPTPTATAADIQRKLRALQQQASAD